jgi:hypothetical protein
MYFTVQLQMAWCVRSGRGAETRSACTTCLTRCSGDCRRCELNIADAAVQKGAERISRRGSAPSSDMICPRPWVVPATVIDDYGHHPVEMAATLAAARGALFGGAWCWPSSCTVLPARATALKISP